MHDIFYLFDFVQELVFVLDDFGGVCEPVGEEDSDDDSPERYRGLFYFGGDIEAPD